MKLLLAEDDLDLGDAVARMLQTRGFEVTRCAHGLEAIAMARRHSFDAVLLDLNLPDKEGIEVLRTLRDGGSRVPVLVMTARTAVHDRILGLNEGADDYLTKPFELPELEARVRALIRRGQAGGSAVLTHGALALDLAGRRATLHGAPVELSAREIAVLEVLMLRSGRVVNKDQLAGQIYGQDEEVGANAIEVYVHRLRKKLEPSGVAIRTIRGLGYLLEKKP